MLKQLFEAKQMSHPKRCHMDPLGLQGRSETVSELETSIPSDALQDRNVVRKQRVGALAPQRGVERTGNILCSLDRNQPLEG